MTTARRRGILAVVTAVVLLALGLGRRCRRRRCARHPHRAGRRRWTPADPVVPASPPPSRRRGSPRVDAPPTARVDARPRRAHGCRGRRLGDRGRGIPHRLAGDGRRRRRVVPAERHAPTRCASRPRARPAPCAASTTSPPPCAPAPIVTEHLGDAGHARRAAVPHGRPRRGRRRRPTRPQWVGRHRLLARSQGVRGRATCADPPYIDQAALADAYDDFEAFLAPLARERLQRRRLARVRRVRDLRRRPGRAGLRRGRRPHVARALALREAFGPFWDRAARARHEGLPPHRHARPSPPRSRSTSTDRFGSSTPRTPSSGRSTPRASTSCTRRSRRSTAC